MEKNGSGESESMAAPKHTHAHKRAALLRSVFLPGVSPAGGCYCVCDGSVFDVGAGGFLDQ